VSWNAYSGGVPEEWPKDAAILIDPDAGIKPAKCKNPEKYVTYDDDVNQIVEVRSMNSVILVTQFLVKDAPLREDQLKKRKGGRISSNDCVLVAPSVLVCFR
jgi:hypothetical protein